MKISGLSGVVLSLDCIEAKLMAARSLRKRGFSGPIVSHALYADHVEAVREAGADDTYLTMHEAGTSLARNVRDAMQAGKRPA